MNDRLEEAVLDAMLEASKRTRERMADGVPVLVSTNVPRELLGQYLQLLRSWDVEHGMDSAIGVLGVPKDELLAIFAAIEPPFPFMEERAV